MKNEGKRFEEDFKASCKDVLFERFNDSNKFGFGDGTRFTPQNPCDGFIFKFPKLIYVELKSTQGSSFSFALKKTSKTVMIKSYQIDALLNRAKYDGVFAGLVLNFRARSTKTKVYNNAVYYLDIDDFYNYVVQNDKKSINEDDAKKIGIIIDCKKKES